MPATTSTLPDLLDVRITKVWDDEYDHLVSEDNPLEILFNIRDTNRAYEIESQVGAFGDIGEFTGSLNYDDVSQGFRTQYNVKEFAGGFKVQRLLRDTDQFNVMENKASGLSEAAYRSIAKDAMRVIIEASTVPMPGPGGQGDGKPLADNAHTSNAGAFTFDNLFTTALSATQIETIRQSFMRTRNDRNEIISIVPDLLIVPPELEETAYEVIASAGKVNTDNNNKNFHEGKYKLYVSSWLTSPVDWAFVSIRHMKKWLNWFWLTKPEFGRDIEFDTFLRKYYVYYARGKGWTDWRWMSFSDVA